MDDQSECKDYGEMPAYEVEDIGCQCTESGLESEWQWDTDKNCYVCATCGAVQ